MATLTRGQTFGATENVTNTKLHNLVDLGSISGIVDADISAGAAIQFSKLLATGIDASLLSGFANAASAAGKWPFANLPVPFGATYVSLVSIPNASIFPLTLASWVDGASFRNLASIPSGAGQMYYQALVASLASGGVPQYNGSNSFVGTLLQSLSNVIFQWAGITLGGTVAGGDQGLVSASIQSDTSTTGTYSYLKLHNNLGSPVTSSALLVSKFKKMSGIVSLTLYAHAWVHDTSNSSSATVQLTVNGVNISTTTTISTSPTWVNSSTLDVSGLVNGTVYDLSIQIIEGNSGGANAYAYCDSVIVIGS